MPRPQVPDHDIPTLHLGLHRRPHCTARILGLLRDPRDAVRGRLGLPGLPRRVGHGLLVLEARGRVRAEPELGRAVGCREVAQGDVGDHVVGALRVVEHGVLVLGLAHPGRVGQGRVCCEPVPDGRLADVAVVCPLVSFVLRDGAHEEACFGETYAPATCSRKELR